MCYRGCTQVGRFPAMHPSWPIILAKKFIGQVPKSADLTEIGKVSGKIGQLGYTPCSSLLFAKVCLHKRVETAEAP